MTQHAASTVNGHFPKVVMRPKCVSCGRYAPGCKCDAADYRWVDGSKA